jgi:tetratricopeptide (TPR) repeat protein
MGSFARPWALVAVSFVSSGATAAAAFGADAPPATPEATAADANKRARDLFAQGQLHYSLGEYPQALADLRGAYELSSAPGLLFNIAQAHRLNGDCKQALEVYRHFIRLASESPYRGEAETHVATLERRCGGAAPPAPAPSVLRADLQAAKPDGPPPLLQSPRADIAAKPAPGLSLRRRTSAALLAGGIGLGLGAGAVYWWNHDRYYAWQNEDQRLSAPMANTPTSAWIADQQRNDARLHSIQRTDTIDLVLAGAAIVAIISSAVLLVISER